MVAFALTANTRSVRDLIASAVFWAEGSRETVTVVEGSDLRRSLSPSGVWEAFGVTCEDHQRRLGSPISWRQEGRGAHSRRLLSLLPAILLSNSTFVKRLKKRAKQKPAASEPEGFVPCFASELLLDGL